MSASVAAGKQLTLQRLPGVGGAVIKLSGFIDDTIDRALVLEGVEGVAVFDLDGVTRITSYGVREWILTLRALPADTYYCFVKCRPSLVSQFNMVKGFGVRGQVVSFYVPYLCTVCDHSFDHLVDLRTSQYGQVTSLQLPELACPLCKNPAEFDEIPESYLEHVASAPQPLPPPRAAALIDGELASQTPVFRVEKEILERVTYIWISGRLERGAQFKRVADGLEGQVVLMLGRLSVVHGPGLKAFSALLLASDIDLLLARVPFSLMSTLAASPERFGRARIISLLLPYRCAEHGDFLLEADAGSLRHSPPRVEPHCPSCGAPGALVATPEELGLLTRLPLVDAPGDVRAALVERPAGPLIVPADRREAAAATANSFGRYELVRRIGLGGMAEVFLARQLGPMGFQKRVVLKRILPQYSAQPAFIEMFLEEARLAARISHSNVVQIFDLGQVADQYYIAMEHVAGYDLGLIFRLCKELGVTIPVDVACRLVMGVCAGLQAAHSCSDDQGRTLVIVHRDVSPHNVLVSLDGHVKVTDFGIARVVDGAARTDPGMVKGKMGYLAPEIFANPRAVDSRVDIFATCVILFQALTQKQPFYRETDAATMRAILHDPTPSLLTYRPDLPPLLDRIVAKGLAKNPAARYASARELEVALEEFLRDYSAPTATRMAEWVHEVFEQAAATGLTGVDELARFTPSHVTTSGEITVSEGLGEDLDLE